MTSGAPYPLHFHHVDMLILGAGGAGMMAAVSAAKKGMRVACISKVFPTRSHTVAAQGGINAALGSHTPDDWRWHMYDTVRGSDWLGDQDAIEIMCRNAPAAIRELENMGVPFSRFPDGKIYQRIYGGQSTHYGKGELAYRACAAADRTGHAILHTLYTQALAASVAFFSEFFALDLIMEEGICKGLAAWDMAEGTIHIFRAAIVVIASGGYGQIFQTNTSSSICTGDGNAMVLRAGLPLQDMEFIQFHPTGIYDAGFLITEAARGEGAYLVNYHGKRFMLGYAPAYGDLASRDVVARAIATEIAEGRGVGPLKDHVHLVLSHLSQAVIAEKLPTVRETAMTFAGIDPAYFPIPVAPSAHYTMGGIPTNSRTEVIGWENGQERTIPGLLAIGEAACTSVHGANRLGCNSLLDLIVFAKVAVDTAVELLPQLKAGGKLEASSYAPLLARLDRVRYAKGEESAVALRRELQQVMQRHAGVFRTGLLLEEGKAALLGIRERTRHMGLKDTSLLWNNTLMEGLELHNLLLQAEATLASASYRTESRGAHYRQDFPERNDEAWLAHTLVWLKENTAETELNLRPVRLLPASGEVEGFPPERRAY